MFLFLLSIIGLGQTVYDGDNTGQLPNTFYGNEDGKVEVKDVIILNFENLDHQLISIQSSKTINIDTVLIYNIKGKGCFRIETNNNQNLESVMMQKICASLVSTQSSVRAYGDINKLNSSDLVSVHNFNNEDQSMFAAQNCGDTKLTYFNFTSNKGAGTTNFININENSYFNSIKYSNFVNNSGDNCFQNCDQNSENPLLLESDNFKLNERQCFSIKQPSQIVVKNCAFMENANNAHDISNIFFNNCFFDEYDLKNPITDFIITGWSELIPQSATYYGTKYADVDYCEITEYPNSTPTPPTPRTMPADCITPDKSQAEKVKRVIHRVYAFADLALCYAP